MPGGSRIADRTFFFWIPAGMSFCQFMDATAVDTRRGIISADPKRLELPHSFLGIGLLKRGGPFHRTAFESAPGPP